MKAWRSPKAFRIPWIRFPFVRIFVPFTSGILAADVVKVSTGFLLGIIGIGLMILILSHLKSRDHWIMRDVFGVTSGLIYLMFGILWTIIRDERNVPNHFTYDSNVELVTRTYFIEEKDRYWDCYSHALFQIDSTGSRPCQGNLLLRIPKSIPHLPAIRDLYQGVYLLRTPDQESAPYEFNWNKMLHYRNVHQVAYLDSTRYAVLATSSATWVELSRDRVDRWIDQLFDSDRDYPVASAMLLGLRKKMDPELYTAYSATGAIHVLAVSGMHVGIIAHIFTLLFSGISFKNKYSRLIQMMSIVTIIWGYTFITGASPSIVRSAMMFTLFALSTLLQRDTAPINILAGTAFALLLIQPLDIYNIGFQLSFGAMTGIFLLYEPIRNLIVPPTKVLQMLWNLIALSLSAQLFIYPLVGFFFHQFAFYFWLTSLISTPFSYIILIGGMIALPIQALGLSFLHILTYPVVYGIKWMNDIIAWIYTLPLGKVRGWWPTPLECILLIAFACALTYSLSRKSIASFKAPLVCLIAFYGLMLYNDWKDTHHAELVAGNFRGTPKVFVKDGSSLLILTSDSTITQSNYVEKFNFDSAHIVHLHSNQLAYESNNLNVRKNLVKTINESYQLITSPKDTVSITNDANVLILNKWWGAGAMDSHSADFNILVPSGMEISKYAKLFPNAHIHQSRKSYIQIELPR